MTRSEDVDLREVIERVNPQVALRYSLHPNFIWRIGGEPTKAMLNLSERTSAHVLARIDTLTANACAASPAVCAELELIIPGIEDRQLRRDVLALKRDLHGLRRPKFDPGGVPGLSGDTLAATYGLIVMLTELAELEAAFTATADAELHLAEERLAAAFQSPNVRDGLRAVNPGLFHKLEAHYRRLRPGKANKAERQLDNAFVQYLSRAALKTSPLSSLTVVQVGQWDQLGARTVSTELPKMPLRRSVSLRRSLLLDVLTALIQQRVTLSEDDPLRLNLSMRTTETQIVFNRIIAEPSLKAMTWGVGLEEMRLQLGPALATVLRIFGQSGTAGLSLQNLNALIGQPQPALIKAVGELVRLNVLQPVDGFYEQDDPLVVANNWLKKSSTSAGDRASIVQLEKDRQALEVEPDAAIRSAIADRIGDQLHVLAAIAGTPLSDDIVKPFLYEDCLVETPATMSQTALEPFLKDLQRILALSPLFDMNAGLQSWLAESFVAQYGVDGVCTDPRTFLLDQMRRIDGVIAPWTISSVTAGTADGQALKTLRDAFFDHIAAQIREDQDCTIDPDFIDDLISRIPEKVARRPKSHSFFGQIAKLEGGSQAFVLNQILSGHSQLFARFLHGQYAPTQTLRDYLKTNSRTGRIVELSGVYGFNANLHQSVSEETLVVAPYPGNRLDEGRIELDQSTLHYDDDLGRLFLADRAGEPMDVLYLGLLNPGLMPQVQRILCGLSMQAPIFFSELSSAMRRAGQLRGGGSFSTPRVTMGNVVLQRRARNVSNAQLPDLAKLDPALAFRRLHQWRSEEQLPASGFVRFAPSQQQLSVAGTDEADVDWSTFDRTKLKPFYVNFADPLLVRQFLKSLNATRFDLVVQEALPDLDDRCFTVAGAGHVAELQLELSATAVD